MSNDLLTIGKKHKFGYYDVGGLHFFSKIQAIQHSRVSQSEIKWIFNDHYFESHDWTKEPSQSLEDLYFQRARQIRNKYDYVVLWYSGGADSHNALMSFLKAEVHIDEIVVNHFEEADSQKPGYWTDEVRATALPDINYLSGYLVGTKIRYVDLTKSFEHLYQGDLRWDWLYEQNCNLSPNNYIRGFIREIDPHYKKLIDQGLKVAFVWGSDKPRLIKKDGRYGVYFQDLIDNCVTPRTQQLDRPWEHDELFYWSADCVPLIIKQSHVLQRWLKAATVDNPWLVHEHNLHGGSKDMGSIEKSGHTYYLTREGLSNIIYPWWPSHRWQQPKPLSGAFSPRDGWFFSENHQDKLLTVRQAYLNGIQKLPELIGNEWLNVLEKKIPKRYWFDTKLYQQFQASGGIKNCISRIYWLDSAV